MSMMYPIALYGLLSIPLIILIHALYRKKKISQVSTLFLIEDITPQNPQGHRIKRLLQNPSLWLQLLALLLLTWLAIGMIWQQKQSVKKVAVVLDTSTSMLAFSDHLPETLNLFLDKLNLDADLTEWHLLSSHIEDPQLYKGVQRNNLIEALTTEVFHRGLHDLHPSLEMARSLVGLEGEVILVTDHKTAPQPNIHQISIGQPIENVGFVGAKVIEKDNTFHWAVTLQNPGPRSQTRELYLGNESTQELAFSPYEIKTLEGQFSNHQDWLKLKLSEDDYPKDDQLTFIKPEQKPCYIQIEPSIKQHQQLRNSFHHIYPNNKWRDERESQMMISTSETPHEKVHIIFHPTKHPIQSKGLSTIAQPHPFIKNLNWELLSIKLQHMGELKARAQDQVLVWHEDQPLILLRSRSHQNGTKTWHDLHFNFPYQDELWDLPSFSILMYRFLHHSVESFPGHEKKNILAPHHLLYTSHQDEVIDLVWSSGKRESYQIRQHENAYIPIPPSEQTLLIKKDNDILRQYAIQSIDAREGDFKSAEAHEHLLPQNALTSSEFKTLKDPFAPLWIFLALSALALDWTLRRKKVAP